jgi:DNA-binding IclR family transcriptional regulator
VPKESDTERYGLTMRMYELGARSLHQEVRRPHPLRSHSPSDRNNHVCARLSVSFPSFRYDMACEPELVAMLPDASRAISRQLGCSPFPLDAAAGPR